jgi:DNA-binding CsgD family transcriptional regulator
MSKEPMMLSDVDKELMCLVAVGLTDDEIATQLRIPKRHVLDHIARLLAGLGARDRLEILFYAYSDATMCDQISAEASAKDRKRLKAQSSRRKQKRKTS